MKIRQLNSIGRTVIRHRVNIRLKWLGFTALFVSYMLCHGIYPALAQTIQEVRIRWDAYIFGSPQPQVSPGKAIASNVLTLLERRSVLGQVPRQRYPQLSSNQVVVIARNGNGQITDLQIIPDPRVLRAELPGPSGELSGQVLHHASTELLFALRDDSTTKEVELYHPRWTGTDYVLDIIGRVPLN